MRWAEVGALEECSCGRDRYGDMRDAAAIANCDDRIARARDSSYERGKRRFSAIASCKPWLFRDARLSNVTAGLIAAEIAGESLE